MENLILSFNVVAPLFLMMVLGYFLKYIKIFDQHTLDVMNKVVFKVFLPVLLFYNVLQIWKQYFSANLFYLLHLA